MSYEYETIVGARSIRISTFCPTEEHLNAIERVIETTELEEASHNALFYTCDINEDDNASQDHELFIHDNRKYIARDLSDGSKRIRLFNKTISIWTKKHRWRDV
jgi:hypothetical protein